MLGTIVTNQVLTYNNATTNALKNPATALGHEFILKVQQLSAFFQQQQHLTAQLAAQLAAKAAAGQLLGPLFAANFVHGINDAYYVTFGLSILSALLAFTLPGRPHKQNTPPAGQNDQTATTMAAETAV